MSGMQYGPDYEYLWPPRPENKIAPALLGFYENRRWVGQIKKNGTCNVIAVSPAPNRELIVMNRHKEDHKLWTPTEGSSAAFKALPGTGWYVFVAELLHSKVMGGPRDTNYVFDVLVADGTYLVGKTFMERQAIMNGLFPTDMGSTFSHRIIDPHTWVARLFTEDFRGVFDGLTSAEDEGIVLKNPMSTLEPCSRKAANASWQVKCRKPHKNFSF